MRGRGPLRPTYSRPLVDETTGRVPWRCGACGETVQPEDTDAHQASHLPGGGRVTYLNHLNERSPFDDVLAALTTGDHAVAAEGQGGTVRYWLRNAERWGTAVELVEEWRRGVRYRQVMGSSDDVHRQNDYERGAGL